MARETFPILGGKLISEVPWRLAESIRGQARMNHGQSLEGLASRGGLDPTEFLGAFLGLGWSDLRKLKQAGFDQPACEEVLIRLAVLSREAPRTQAVEDIPRPGRPTLDGGYTVQPMRVRRSPDDPPPR